MIQAYSEIKTLATDPVLNASVTSFRDRTASPYSFGRRHSRLHNLSNGDGSWIHETRLLPLYGVEKRELTQLREEARKYFARMRHNERSIGFEQHPLAGDEPLTELSNRLNTEAIVLAGHRGGFLGRKQKKRRRARIEEDRQLLAGMILLMANAAQTGDGVFTLSYTLAVASYCLA